MNRFSILMEHVVEKVCVPKINTMSTTGRVAGVPPHPSSPPLLCTVLRISSEVVILLSVFCGGLNEEGNISRRMEYPGGPASKRDGREGS